MREEIAAAVIFITRLVKKNEKLSHDQVDGFSRQLSTILGDRFKNHWYHDDPEKGQGYRCIRPNDPWIMQAATDSGLDYKDLNMPPELTIWVDPKEVCCRFGENKGSWCTLFRDGPGGPAVLGPACEKALSQSDFAVRSRPFSVSRINGPTGGATSPPGGAPVHHHQGDPSSGVRNYNHNHNNNLVKFKRFGQPRARAKCDSTPQQLSQPLPQSQPLSHSPTSFGAKSAGSKFSPTGSPTGKHFRLAAAAAAHAQFQQQVAASVRNDRYHWVRGADLVKA